MEMYLCGRNKLQSLTLSPGQNPGNFFVFRRVFVFRAAQPGSEAPFFPGQEFTG